MARVEYVFSVSRYGRFFFRLSTLYAPRLFMKYEKILMLKRLSPAPYINAGSPRE
jgi:hypothetical protein